MYVRTLETICFMLPTVNKGNEDYKCEESYKSAGNKEWTTLSSSWHNKLPYQSRNLCQLPLVTSNKFSTLANLNHDNQLPENVLHMKHPNPMNNYRKGRRPPFQCVNKMKHVKQRIITVGDSHARKSAAELKHCLHPTYAISSFVKPGAGMKDVVESVSEDIKKLNHDDFVVIWGGSNDIGVNNSREALNHLCTLVKNNHMVNTVVLMAPPRYDLPPSSCVNNEVITFNRQLKKRLAPYNNVKVIETGLERGYFTKHGLHLNTSRKERIA